jgi:glycosyltransferase involved in cell wall biosynthesis
MTEFREAIIKLLNDKPLRERLGENGRRAIMREFHTEVVKENLISIYSKGPDFKL